MTASDARLLLHDKFIDTNSASAKKRVRDELRQHFKDDNVLKKRICPMTNGPPTYEEVTTIFAANGI